jgi:C-terminal processing protease CtpA/Prc
MNTVAQLGVMRMLLGIACLAIVAGCGGGGGSSSGGSVSMTPGAGGTVSNANPTFTANSYPSSSTFAARCAAPRSGTDPSTNAPYADRAGSVVWENFWLRSWTNELYLWYREVADRDPALDATSLAYFNTQKTTAITSSGKPKDQFHFTYATSDWIALSQSGVSAGYGAEFVLLARSPPRAAVVAFTEPGSPAASANITRGVRVLRVDGIDLVNDNTQAGIDTLNAGLYPSAAGQSHSFVIQDLNGSTRTVNLVSANVTETPVQNVQTYVTSTGATVGYMLFNDHIATSEVALFNAFTQMRNANVADLVLDIRYNGGGFLSIASEVGFMIAGSTASNNRVFEATQFNDRYASNLNPVTGGANTPEMFRSVATGMSVASGTALPTLNLPRVFVITGGGTCSASESIINGLRGIGLQVIQIGTGTCGKPYGFYPADNCGTTYFSIQLQGANAAGFSGYADGFAPQYPAGNLGVLLPGCTVADDFTKALGDINEHRLAAALYYRANGSCSSALTTTVPSANVRVELATSDDAADPLALRAPARPWREIRILGIPNSR